LTKGSRLRIESAGGGGYGDPRERERQLVEEDIANGYVDAGRARLV